MSRKIWEDEQEGYSELSEDTYTPQFTEPSQQEPEYEEPAQEVIKQVYRPEKIVNRAVLRLEQGKLYQMLLEHDLFSDVDANQQAIDNVQKEMRDFITSRLEILLGLRQEGEIVQIQPAQNVFTEDEVEALKAVAAKMNAIKQQDEKTGNFKPVVAEKAKNMLSSISKPKTESHVHQPIKQVSQPQKKVVQQQKPTKPVKQKPVSEMTEAELAERNAQIKNKKAVPDYVKPLPTASQMEMHYTSMINTNPLANLARSIANAKKVGA